MVQGPAASASPENSLEMLNLRSHPRPSESDSFNKTPRDSSAHLSVRGAALDSSNAVATQGQNSNGTCHRGTCYQVTPLSYFDFETVTLSKQMEPTIQRRKDSLPFYTRIERLGTGAQWGDVSPELWSRGGERNHAGREGGKGIELFFFCNPWVLPHLSLENLLKRHCWVSLSHLVTTRTRVLPILFHPKLVIDVTVL